MLNRCYCSKFHLNYPTYKDCTVCEEWHNFQNFAAWFDENYPKDEFGIYLCGYELDKDIKIKGNKIYSPETCMIVTKYDNNVDGNKNKMYTITIKSPDGVIYNVDNQRQFCGQFGLNHRQLNRLIREPTRNHVKGWTIIR